MLYYCFYDLNIHKLKLLFNQIFKAQLSILSIKFFKEITSITKNKNKFLYRP